jgi:hypothetical protein
MRRFQKQTLDADSQAITPKVRAVAHVTVVVKELEGYARNQPTLDRIRVRGSGQEITLLSESMSGVISPTTISQLFGTLALMEIPVEVQGRLWYEVGGECQLEARGWVRLC